MKNEQKIELAQIAAIMSDHICDKLHEKMGTKYTDATFTIALWALEFFNKHKRTNWEKALEAPMKPLSKAGQQIICWDDAVVDFANFKLETLPPF